MRETDCKIGNIKSDKPASLMQVEAMENQRYLINDLLCDIRILITRFDGKFQNLPCENKEQKAEPPEWNLMFALQTENGFLNRTIEDLELIKMNLTRII